MGQSAVVLSDISNFQTAAGVPVRAPSVLLMPNTGTSTPYTGDESESDLDLEYSSGIATGANILFVYTGSSPNYSVFDAMGYAISEQASADHQHQLWLDMRGSTSGQTNYNSDEHAPISRLRRKGKP